MATRHAGSPYRVSILIVNYNGRDDLPDCLESLSAALSSSTAVAAEIIVIDNGSTDDSPTLIGQRFPQVRIIHNSGNHGFGDGCNLGARHATGDYLIFLNPDTIASPGFAEALLEPLATSDALGMTTARLLLRNEPTRINSCGNQVHPSGLTLCRGLRAAADAPAFSRSQHVTAVSGAAFAMRRALFLRLGGFDTLMFMYMEDTDLSLRTWLAGYRVRYVADAVLWHDYALNFGPGKIYHQERNRYIMLLKLFDWRTLLALAPTLLLAEALTWGFVLLRTPRRAFDKLRAYRSIRRDWRRIMAGRHRTQQLRRRSDRELLRMMDHRLAFEQTGAGLVAKAAHLLFDPVFLVCHRLALIIVRW